MYLHVQDTTKELDICCSTFILGYLTRGHVGREEMLTHLEHMISLSILELGSYSLYSVLPVLFYLFT